MGMEKRKKSIAVIDGQGGGIGSAVIKRLREAIAEEVEIIGLGTNAMATGAMLKAGANKCHCPNGENSRYHRWANEYCVGEFDDGGINP
jgi:hypothetical protein